MIFPEKPDKHPLEYDHFYFPYPTGAKVTVQLGLSGRSPQLGVTFFWNSFQKQLSSLF